MTLRILLADDHALVRAGIGMLLAGIPGAEVVGEAADGAQALRCVDELRPDVVLLDISMGITSGLHVLEQIHLKHPATRCIILSMHTDADYVLRALRANAAGYLIKDAAPEELEEALRAVGRGEIYLSKAIPQPLAAPPGPAANAATRLLTPRQEDILRRIAEGQGTKEIAWQLGLSIKTVETHRAQLMERLGIRDVPGLTRYAIRTGLVSAER